MNFIDILLENDQIKLERGSDYIFTGYVPHNKDKSNVPISLIVAENESIGTYAKKFRGQKPHNIELFISRINSIC